MILKVLGSSSHGNCYLAEIQGEVLILDAGVNFKEVQKALSFNFTNVAGALITHEHQDHIKYAKCLANAGVNIYASRETFEAAQLSGHRYIKIRHLEQFEIGNFIILPFKVEHDVEEPLGFLIQHTKTKEKFLYATDTYYLKYRFKGVNYILIECNYIREIAKNHISSKEIESVRYKRLLSSHMSLENCIDFLKASDLSNTKQIVLIHLSDKNSDEKIMKKTIQEATKIETVVAEPGQVINMNLYPF